MSGCRTSVRSDAYCKKKQDQKQRYGWPDGNPPVSIFEHGRNLKTGPRETSAPIIPSSFGQLPSTKTSIGVVRTCIQGYLERAVLSLAGPTLNHPLLLGVLALQVLASDAMDEVCTKGIVPYATQRQTGLHHYDYLRETDAAVLGVTVVGRDLVGTTKRILGASANLTGGGSTPPSRWRRLRGFRSGRFCVFDESVAAVAAAVENDEEALTSPDPTCRTQGDHNKTPAPQARLGRFTSRNNPSSRAGRGLGVATLNLHMAQFQQRHRREEQARQHPVTVPVTVLVLVAWVLWAKIVNPPAERAGRQATAARGSAVGRGRGAGCLRKVRV
ncbi:hypothetical protein MGG_06543 [Pyricularia oryzae 70-15]|uniref:Uncharacterized protein n=2 Tax=Pyricularia oryzae TaxID=318829 RepID=G4N6L1_PYRO7|nr:uncharacterized protein MGG_06543 [Pyricularia oryzae 70-15]EHA50680.1 hypothetical protein MGG_06543 [Pyricularia oryzae 70-15]